ncbi:hypothetical protein BRADI_1g68255v3 [Brachypodium distachyon]|uniref:Uncharacterized protein n=1 Tax=Brachypodium distachyon TaxID=15368 RepID=A0A0Q3JYR7_BRADI|nr:hypothetical protein BRADI_1g68255v3 [Brachypodium distachyon]
MELGSQISALRSERKQIKRSLISNQLEIERTKKIKLVPSICCKARNQMVPDTSWEPTSRQQMPYASQVAGNGL